jgi:hypothetical protein
MPGQQAVEKLLPILFETLGTFCSRPGVPYFSTDCLHLRQVQGHGTRQQKRLSREDARQALGEHLSHCA